MDDFLLMVWFLSLIGIVVGGINLFRAKRNEKEKFTFKKIKKIFRAKRNEKTKITLKQAKTLFWVSIIVSFISFIGVGITAPSVEETSNNAINNTVLEDINNIVQNNIEENTIENNTVKDFTEVKKQELSNIPTYTNEPYVVINGNVPFFNDSDLTTTSYERYSDLDNLGRCGVAVASIGKDIMPTEERGEIGSVKPTGWHTVKYNGIDGNYLYNRCHLIGYQLTAENANEKNLITGTRYMNVQGMLPFENMVADYIEETNNHVLYRVTPIFEGDNLLASGVLMEAKSVEDNGQGIQFNVYCYNVQPGIEINYATGESSGAEYTGSTTNNTNDTSSSNTSSTTSSFVGTGTSTSSASNSTNADNSSSSSNSSGSTSSNNLGTAVETKPTETVTNNNDTTASYVLNTNSKKFHRPSCYSAAKISAKNRQDYNGSRSDLIAQGYEPCKNCDP